LKLKVKVDAINYELEAKPMTIYHVNGIVRYGNRLDDGLYDITINKNY